MRMKVIDGWVLCMRRSRFESNHSIAAGKWRLTCASHVRFLVCRKHEYGPELESIMTFMREQMGTFSDATVSRYRCVNGEDRLTCVCVNV